MLWFHLIYLIALSNESVKYPVNPGVTQHLYSLCHHIENVWYWTLLTGVLEMLPHHLYLKRRDKLWGRVDAMRRCRPNVSHQGGHDYPPGLHFNQSKVLVPVCNRVNPIKGGLFLPVSLSPLPFSTTLNTPTKLRVKSQLGFGMETSGPDGAVTLSIQQQNSLNFKKLFWQDFLIEGAN